MACPELSDLNITPCLNNVGGLELSISVWRSEDRSSIVFDKVTGTYTSIEFGGTTPKLPVTVGYHRNTASFVQTGTGEITTANSTNAVTLDLTINAQDFAKTATINALAAGMQDLDIALAYNNGTKWFLPNAQLLNYVANSGVLKADGSNYVLTFTAEYDSLVGGIEDVDFETLITTGAFGGL